MADIHNGIYEVVLVEPEIPQNAGNIARLCGAAGVRLHLVRPLGFFLDDRHMRRAGLDYWDMVNVTVHDDFDSLILAFPSARLVLCTTKGSVPHSQIQYHQGDLLVFGAESRGLPQSILDRPGGLRARIPMREGLRSLNLSNSVAIVLYEAMRQAEYQGLKLSGSRSVDDPDWV